MNSDLSNKRAVVCGSTQGIGKASARELALLGASVTLVARNEEKLKETLAGLDTAKKQKHHYIIADFSDPAQLEQQLKKYLQEFPVNHILVNNTGGPAGGQAIDAKPEDFIKTFSNHLICNQLLVQSLVPGMKDAGYGRIINIISTSVKQPIKGLGVSNTIRGAVASWSKTLAGELAQFAITVNNVLPGATRTERLSTLITAKAEKSSRPESEIEKEMLHEIPAGRFAEADEIAQAVGFLASPAAAYINGINLPVDGGRTACL
jgi:3-oxoacyl-[acyl-carrier protein] reductase